MPTTAASVKPTSGLTQLQNIKPLYFLPQDNLAEEALIPCFKHADAVDCMVGFFSSGSLATLAPGLATFIQRSEKPLRLIVSPYISAADQVAIEAGTKGTVDAATDAVTGALLTEDQIERHTLRCLSYLLRVGRIELRIAVMKNALFHPKVWLFRAAAQDVLAVHGSGNMTVAGIMRNFEQITVSRNWDDVTQRYIVEKLMWQFDRLWRNVEEDCEVVSAPQAIRDHILQAYPAEDAPTEEQLRELFRKAKKVKGAVVALPDPTVPASPSFGIPASLTYEDGPFAHQGKAARAWVDAGFRGVLEMATGSGKTITSMIGACKLHAKHRPLLIVVAAPYVPLIQQWCDEMTPFGLTPNNLTDAAGAVERGRLLRQAERRLRLGISDVEAVVVSHDTLCSDEFSNVLRTFECKKLLIADEAHNLGRPSFVDTPPDYFEYRLALSATPERQYDAEGTAKLLSFFGNVVFAFTLQEAIGRCLVEYDYFVHPVPLTDLEMSQWYELSAQIKANVWRQQDGKPDDYLAKLYRDRRALLETASGKILLLDKLLSQTAKSAISYTLIYGTDKAPEQLESVNRLLSKHGILFHQLTAEETSNRDLTRQIIRSFQDKEIQVLTAKRVLDEGVNIPQIQTAYVLASTTVERQWVQRRGRLLRTCPAIGKAYSTIHDFLALPADMDQATDPEARSLLKGELRRIQEFASLARNAGRPGGPLEVIRNVVNAAFN